MKNKCYIIPFALTCAAASIQASATEQYESCSAILAHNALNVYENTMEFRTKIALKKWVCSSDFSSDDSARNLAKDVARIFSVDGHVGGLNKWKANNCSADDSAYEGSQATHALIQSASISTVSAWSQCMQDVNSTSLTCHAEQAGDVLVMNINAKSIAGGLVDVTTRTNNLTPEADTPNTVEQGVTSIRYQIDDKNVGSYFEIIGSNDNGPVSCSYSVPSRPTIERAACEVFRKQSLVQEKISVREYEFMKEHNKVPLFDYVDGRLIGMFACEIFIQ